MDVSIKNLKKYVFEPKTQSLRTARAHAITSSDMIVTEKVDGTKLTLVRTPETSPEYTKNWIVAYKGEILSAKEFGHLSQQDKQRIGGESVGIGQYHLIFDHLESINDRISKIPGNTEFSVEFAQNKDTLTRTYENKGGMFLRSFGKVEYRIVSSELHTKVVGQEITEHEAVKKMADLLGIAAFPVFHRGPITQETVSKNPLISDKMADTNWNDPVDVLAKFSDAMLSIPSTLGGTTEGVVLRLADGQLFKLVQADQYDKEVRDAKKQLYRLDPEAAALYFQQIRELIKKIFQVIGAKGKSAEDVISDTNFYVSKHQKELGKFFEALVAISGGKKNLTQINDDIHDTVRLLVSKRDLTGDSSSTLALIPIAGKPVHLGHWKLIEKAAKENERVVVYTSSSDRVRKGEFPIKGEDFVQIWSDILIPNLPKNVSVKFVDSPVRACLHELAWLEQKAAIDKDDVPTVSLYSDKEDVEANFKDSDLEKYPTLLSGGKVRKVGVSRSDTVNVSGTKMREFLQTGDKAGFFAHLPPVSQKDKEAIWNILLDSAASMSNLEETYMFERSTDLAREIAMEIINEEYVKILLESGQSVAAVDPKTPKTVNGQPAQATSKLAIVTKDGIDVRSSVAKDIRELVHNLNGAVGFWKKNSPYIENGFVFNGSSQYLMSGDEKYKELSKYKSSFGDVDVIVPMEKLDALEAYLDSVDDNKVVWKPTPKNKLSTNFYYVGRTKNFRALAGQTVTLWYYAPTKQVVQIDFEGDDMILDPQGYEKPSEWNKFIKDSPWEDLVGGIKGLAGAILLRGLTRAATALPNAVYVTSNVASKIESGEVNNLITPKGKSLVSVNAAHALPSKYTLNTSGSGHPGVRKAYRLVAKDMPYGSKKVDVYTDIPVSQSAPEDRITNVKDVFKLIFRREPSSADLTSFRSYIGLMKLMKELPRNVQVLAMERAKEGLSQAGLSPEDYAPIKKSAKDILKIEI